jgi:hypothetical protein
MWRTRYYAVGLMASMAKTVVKEFINTNRHYGRLSQCRAVRKMGDVFPTLQLIKFRMWFHELHRSGTCGCGRVRLSRERVASDEVVRSTRIELKMRMKIKKKDGKWMRDTDGRWLVSGYWGTETEEEWHAIRRSRRLKQHEGSWSVKCR